MKRNKISGKTPVHKPAASEADNGLKLEQNQFKLTWPEYFAAPVAAILAAVWAFPYLGTSIEWDDLFYMNVSQYTTKQAWVLNRYGHIYLQKFFFWLAGDALTGAKIYWSFLVFSTCVLVYWCARMLAGKRGYIVGLVAVLFLCSYQLFVYYAGCTFADLTVMFLLMLGTFVYFAFLVDNYKHRRLIIIILGLLFFWAVKSKETGICMGLLFFGLGEDEAGARSVRCFIKDIGWVCVGMLIGCVLLMALDQIFLRDAWFSMRPSSIRELFSYNLTEYIHDQKNRSWFTTLSMGPILTIFMLYILVGQKLPGRVSSRHEIYAWLIPLIVMFFLSASSIRVQCGTVPRFLFPAIAGLCVWGAQFFRFEISGLMSNGKFGPRIPKAVTAIALVLLAFIVASFVTQKAPDAVRDAGWKSPERFYTSVILPLSTMGLIICGNILRKQKLTTVFLMSLCLFFLIYFPVSNNIASLKQRFTATRSELRYEPYRIFADELRFDKDVKILVSKDINASSRSLMLGREVRSHCWMFNVFFNQNFDEGQFIDGGPDDIVKGSYTYAFLTLRDWKGISERHYAEHLLEDYERKVDKRTQLILLKKK